jgi:hypothetical protein
LAFGWPPEGLRPKPTESTGGVLAWADSRAL